MILVADDRWTGEGRPEAMLCWEEFLELRNLHERGWSVSAIARHLGKDRKTVRHYLTNPDARPGVCKPTGKLIDPYAANVQARLEDNPHLAGTVLDRELGELGFAGSYRTLARHLAGVRPDCPACHGPEPAESVVPATARARPRRTGRRSIGPRPGRRWRSRWGCSRSSCAARSSAPTPERVRHSDQSTALLGARPMPVARVGSGVNHRHILSVPTEVRCDRTTQVFRPLSRASHNTCWHQPGFAATNSRWRSPTHMRSATTSHWTAAPTAHPAGPAAARPHTPGWLHPDRCG
jgi:hypothetical protein